MNTRLFFPKFFSFPLVRIICAVLVIVIAHFLKNELSSYIPGIVTILITIFSYVIYVKIFEKRQVEEFSKKNAIKEAFIGFIIGFFIISIVIISLYFLGFYSVQGVNAIPLSLRDNFLIDMLITFIGTGVSEEILFRGIIFRISEEKLGSTLAMFISCVFFAFWHLGNPHSSFAISLGLALEGGILLSAAYMYARRLWLPIFIHAAWNFAEGSIFGTPVSGIWFQGIVKNSLHGPPFLTGGAFGLEASFITILLGTCVGFYFLYLAHRKGNFVRPFWKLQKRPQ